MSDQDPFIRSRQHLDTLHPRELWHAKWPTLAADLSWLVAEVERLRGQVQELETLVRAHNRLEQAMYDTDSEWAWPKDAGELQRAYERKYDVEFLGDEQP